MIKQRITITLDYKKYNSIYFKKESKLVLSGREREKERERGRDRDRETKDRNTGLLYWHFLTYVVIPYSGPHLGLLLSPALGGAQYGFYPDLIMTNWLTVTPSDWRGNLCINNFITRSVLLVRDSCDLFIPTYRLFSGNHFVYTAITSRSRNPWLTVLSNVNM